MAPAAQHAGASRPRLHHRGDDRQAGAARADPTRLVGRGARPRRGGAVLVANHASHLDPLTFAHFVHEQGRVPRYLAKAALFDVFFAGWVLRSSGQIPVHRLSSDASRAFDAAVAAVREGKLVVVYPEGTLTRDPDLWPMVGKTGCGADRAERRGAGGARRPSGAPTRSSTPTAPDPGCCPVTPST